MFISAIWTNRTQLVHRAEIWFSIYTPNIFHRIRKTTKTNLGLLKNLFSSAIYTLYTQYELGVRQLLAVHVFRFRQNKIVEETACGLIASLRWKKFSTDSKFRSLCSGVHPKLRLWEIEKSRRWYEAKTRCTHTSMAINAHTGIHAVMRWPGAYAPRITILNYEWLLPCVVRGRVCVSLSAATRCCSVRYTSQFY